MAELEYESGLDLNDWQDIAQITDALGLFELVTKEISSEKEVVISKIPYMMEQIIQHVKTLNDSSNSSDSIIFFYSKLLNETNTRFDKIKISSNKYLMLEATFLDPRLKNQGFESHSVYSDTRKSIENRGATILGIQATHQNHQLSTSTSTSTSTPDTTPRSSLWDSFDQKVSNTVQRSITPLSKMIIEIDRYLNEPLLPRDEDPLKWWRQSRNVYPTLYEEALYTTNISTERENFLQER